MLAVKIYNCRQKVKRKKNWDKKNPEAADMLMIKDDKFELMD